jgi:CheY-like chemotaxis protein
MVEQGHALMAILDDILDLSRIEAEKIELEFRDINVVKVLCDLHRLMLSRAEDTGLRFELDLSGKFPLRFRTDAVRLRQVIVNLLSNAFKFTPQGQVTLASRCMHSDYGSELQIEVTDSGVGIDKEDLQRIFDAFSRLHHPHAKAAGTGLGLTIAHRLTERLGGELDVESTPNEGTTFTIRIPVQPPEQTEYIDHREAMDDSRTGPRSNGASAQKQLPLHVLVAEDTDAIRFLLSKILSPAVEKLTMVEDGAQALHLVQSDDSISLVLMDMQMPVMSGVDATRAIRKAGYTLPVVALTAGAMDADRNHCIEAGCSEFLSKPINKRKLLDLLEKLAEHREASK